MLARLRAGVLAVALVALGSPASAQEEAPPAEGGPSPENVEATQQARQHFMAGVDHFSAHRYREAIRSFSLAAQLVPSADLWFNIARAHEELSEYEEAIEHYQRYLRDRVDPPDRADIERHIEELRARAEREREARRTEPTTGTLRLTANREGARIELDDEDAGSAPWAEPREVTPGRHRLVVLREGYIPFRSEVSVEAGVPTAAYADLTPETRFRAIQADRIFTWIAWGLGVASLGVSIGLGVEAASRQADLASARDWAAYSDGALAAGIGLGVVGLILWFVEGRSVGTERVTVETEAETRVRGPE
ncbi:MAG: PEGA domain-containing protein [Sandaracinaceae bacterium]|nr:PEGA domain-containing protein [Sandaracinaceae bacterium]